MAKFKTLNRFLGRIGLKKSKKQDLKRTSLWSAIWHRKSNTESTRSTNNGSTPSRGNSGILKALSSFFKRKSEAKPSDSDHGQNEQSRESHPENIDILVEPSIDHQSFDQYSINDPPEEIITEDELSESDASDYFLSSLDSILQMNIDLRNPCFSCWYKEEHEICSYCRSLKEVATRPEYWESSNEWLIFDVPEEPEPQIQLKPKKKVTWEEDDDDEHVTEINVEGVDDECLVEMEMLDDEKPRQSILCSEQNLCRWITAVFIVFLILLFM